MLDMHKGMESRKILSGSYKSLQIMIESLNKFLLIIWFIAKINW